MLFVLLLTCSVVAGLPEFETRNFKVGIEYDNSLPMAGGSDKYRHRNNYEPFFVTITATVKKNYVISYLEVAATIDALGEVEFCLLSGKTGSQTMVFQLISNHTDFLSYSYLTYGILEEDYKKVTAVANVITVPFRNRQASVGNSGNKLQIHFLAFLFVILLYIYCLI